MRYSEGLHWAVTCPVSCLTIRVSTPRYKHISLQRRQKYKLQLAIGLMLSTKKCYSSISVKQRNWVQHNQLTTHTHTFDFTQTRALSSSCVYVWQHKTCSLTVTSLRHLVRKSDISKNFRQMANSNLNDSRVSAVTKEHNTHDECDPITY